MQTSTITNIIIVFITLGAIAAASTQIIGQAEGASTSEVQIETAEQLAELKIYTTVISYQCTDAKGGINEGVTIFGGSYWTSFENYKENDDFEELEEVYPSRLACAGAEEHLPLADGVGGELPGAAGGTGNWINDQPGIYSRQRFQITSDLIETVGCMGYSTAGNDEEKQFGIVVTDSDTDNIARFNEPSAGYADTDGGVGMNLNPSDCYAFGPDDGVADRGPTFILNVITSPDKDIDDIGNIVGSFTGLEGVAGSPDQPDGDLYSLELCEGTQGYVQSNVGHNDEEEGADTYTLDNVPGDPDLNVDDEVSANTPHPYIVITDYTCDD